MVPLRISKVMIMVAHKVVGVGDMVNVVCVYIDYLHLQT